MKEDETLVLAIWEEESVADAVAETATYDKSEDWAVLRDSVALILTVESEPEALVGNESGMTVTTEVTKAVVVDAMQVPVALLTTLVTTSLFTESTLDRPCFLKNSGLIR